MLYNEAVKNWAEGEIRILENALDHAKRRNEFYNVAKLELEIEKLKKMIKEPPQNIATSSSLQAKYDHSDAEITRLQNEITTLKATRAALTGDVDAVNAQKSEIDAKIEKNKAQIARLGDKKTRIVGRQAIYLGPKLFVESKKGLFQRHYMAKTKEAERRINGNKGLADYYSKKGGVLGSIKAEICNLKIEYYEKRVESYQAICDRLNGNTTVNGANRMTFGQGFINGLLGRGNAQQAAPAAPSR